MTMQTNPEQWAVELWHLAYNASENCATQSFGDDDKAAALAIQAAFTEREARLVGALDMVGKVLPSAAGLDGAPDSKIIACYMSMGEFRAVKATLADLKDRTDG